jgi:hypothetical protein
LINHSSEISGHALDDARLQASVTRLQARAVESKSSFRDRVADLARRSVLRSPGFDKSIDAQLVSDLFTDGHLIMAGF